MLSVSAIVLGYTTLVLSFGWQGVVASAVHIAVMLISTRPRG